MKIAVAKEGNDVSAHFGHCEGFQIYEVEEKEVKGRSFVSNPGHRPGFLPNYLNDLGVNVVISGGMGGGAIAIFEEHGIKVITGASGEVEDVVQRYINGDLRSTGSICHEHQHANECGEY